MTKRDSQLKALQKPEAPQYDPTKPTSMAPPRIPTAEENEEFLRNLGIKSRRELMMPTGPGQPLRMRDVHEPMNVFELAAAGNWPQLGRIGSNLLEDIVRAPQQMFGPSGPEAQRLHQLYGTQPERFTPELNPIERSQADLAQLLYGLVEPGPGSAGILGGTKATREMMAQVMNIFRKNLKGPARRGLLQRLERGLLLQDIPSSYVETPTGVELGTLADLTLGEGLSKKEVEGLVRDLKRAGFMGDPRAASHARRAETIMRRQRAIDKRLHKKFVDPNRPPPSPEGAHPSRMRLGSEAGPSTQAHEVGHLVELELTGQPQSQIRHYAKGLERPDITDPREAPVYWLQTVMAGERYPFSFAELEKMAGRGVEVTEDLIKQAKLREILEQQGVNVRGFYNTVPREQMIMTGEPNFLKQLAGEERVQRLGQGDKVQKLFERQAAGEYLSPQDAAFLEEYKRSLRGGVSPMAQKMAKRR